MMEQSRYLDFGLAKVTTQTQMTKMGSTIGTVAYMSPEQTRGETVDQRTDIWSLGVVLYEMLTGQLPFKGNYEQAIVYSILNEEPILATEINSAVPAELEEIISKALSKIPESRYSSTAVMLNDLKVYRDSLLASKMNAFDLKTIIRLVRKPSIAFPTMAIILLIIVCFVWFTNRQEKISWVKDEAIPEIRKLVEEAKYLEAFQVAKQASQIIPDDSLLNNLWPEFTWVINIKTNPSKADIYMKEYSAINSEWEFIGQSPIDSFIVPRGVKRWKIEKAGFLTIEAAGGPTQSSVHNRRYTNIFEFTLDKKGTIPEGMVRVGSGETEAGNLEDFFIDKFEVTNKQYKAFIDKGGYQKREYWKHKFIKDGDTLSWEEAISHFCDATGRPGPATWQAGDYSDGKDDFPVNGVSWYEAAAYAEFVGKSLPTIYHWRWAAGVKVYGSEIIPLSNFSEAKGPVPVGSYQGISQNGLYDIAGNVREWCWNESRDGRIVRGGAWNDVNYMFTNISQQSPFNRSEKNGFRCISYINSKEIPPKALEPFRESGLRDYYTEKPVSSAIFESYKQLYMYDLIPLDPIIEWRDEKHEDWIKERISFNAAYDNERMIAFLFLPKSADPPYQTVILFPGSGVISITNSEDLQTGVIDFIVKNGRAVIYPIYKGTHERGDGGVTWPKGNSYQESALTIKQVKDLRRSLDYLETRTDIDLNKLGYYGYSWGGKLGGLIPALEDRINVSILYLGGMRGQKRPEIDEINFVSRISIPVLMLNGRFDFTFPLKACVIPMFKLLRTPERSKRLVLYDTDHFIPRNERIKESLDWLDKYLGPVKK